MLPRIYRIFKPNRPTSGPARSIPGQRYLGTGHDGRIYRVTAEGAVLVIRRRGVGHYRDFGFARRRVIRGLHRTARSTALLRWARRCLFRSADKYIWSLAILNDGAVAVARR